MSETKKPLDLMDIKGIGEKTKEKMVEAGITTVEQLATRRGEEVAEMLNITKKAAKDIVNDAKVKALDSAIKSYTFNEILKHKKEVTKSIPTGSLALDNLLKGGVKTEAITILGGEYASGKSQLCNQLMVNVMKAGRAVAWIETEAGTFSPDRILEIAEAAKVKITDENFYFIPALEVTDPYRQFLAYELVEKWAREKGKDLGLIIIDSFSARFRSFYSGREMLPDRSQEESRHFGKLDTLASRFNCAVVLTAQVMDVPDAGQQLGAIMKTGTRKQLTGGNILKHSGTYILSMQKVKMDEWEMIVSDSPDIPFSSARFRILPTGIKDVVTR